MRATEKSGRRAHELSARVVGEVRKQMAIPEAHTLQGLENAVETIISQGINQNDAEETQDPKMNFFVAGWRPMLGWICNIALFTYYIPRFLLGTVFWAIYVTKSGHFIPMPEMGIADIVGLVTTLLGSSGMRTLEKIKGVHDEH